MAYELVTKFNTRFTVRELEVLGVLMSNQIHIHVEDLKTVVTNPAGVLYILGDLYYKGAISRSPHKFLTCEVWLP